MKRVGYSGARVEAGRPVRVRRWWLSQDDELWFVQGYILKVVPIEISKGWDVEVEGKESQG